MCFCLRIYYAGVFYVKQIIEINIGMLKNKLLLLTGLLVCVNISVMGQGSVAEDETSFYDERTWGLFLQTSGYGINYQYGKRINGYRKRMFSVEFHNLQHKREILQQNPFNYTTRRYAYGKLNICLPIKIGWGYQKELYSKFKRGRSVSIKRYYLVGPSLAVLKPVYYEIYSDSLNRNIIERYDPEHNIYTIQGRASFFRGLGELSFVPGGYVRYGYSFEFSKKEKHINAVELGSTFEAYPAKLKILAYDDGYNDNQRFFLSFFLVYRFGKSIL